MTDKQKLRYCNVKPNHIYHGDCVDVMRTFPENVIDLTVTSPPYDNLRTYKGYTFNFV